MKKIYSIGETEKPFRLSEDRCFRILYAAMMTHASITIQKDDRTEGYLIYASARVEIDEDRKQNFEEVSGLRLEEPQRGFGQSIKGKESCLNPLT